MRTFEEIVAERPAIKEFLAKNPLRPKPTAVVTLPVSEKIAAAIKADPQSVRVAARGEDGVQVVEGPKRNAGNVTVRVDMVREVDAAGRPIWERGGAVSDYDPLERGLHHE